MPSKQVHGRRIPADHRASVRAFAVAGALATIWLAAVARAAPIALPPSPTGITVSVDAATGAYSVGEARPAWTFAGTTGAPLSNVASKDGSDNLGAYTELNFDWTGSDGPRSGSIRRYASSSAVLFTETARARSPRWNNAFPVFNAFPAGLHPFSYTEMPFAPPNFGLSRNATPYLLFDDHADAAVLAPTNNLFLARMTGEMTASGATGQPAYLASGLSARAVDLPVGFAQSTMLYFGSGGIRATMHQWGRVYDALAGARRPASDADLMLKYFGYWTDNGADYYYNYDQTKGYAGTLVDLVQRYRAEKIPIHYLQLDSWWYEKTLTGPDGIKKRKVKNAKLPAGSWNAAGGTSLYRASPALFPDGLAAFHNAIGLPLAVHARWIDVDSPYHKDYQITGVAPVDSKWWDETAAYLKASGVICYEQDWLNEIYNHSPEMGRTPGVGNAFVDNMSRSAEANGEDLQYCMALPCYFLNGARYDNLTTIRVSSDRFERRRWDHFLYTSTLADAMGIWPWVDVFKSYETDNVLLATLSAGPVGTGDAIGLESKANILKSVRADGRIVKPDGPLIPSDESFLADSRKENAPLVAWTYADHAGGPRTAYVFAYTRKTDSLTGNLPLPELGLGAQQAYVYNYFTQRGKVFPTNSGMQMAIPRDPGYSYYVVAPVGPSGIALIGDSNLFVGAGHERLPLVNDHADGLDVTVALSPEERSVTLIGWSPVAPSVRATEGQAGAVNYDPSTQRFAITLTPNAQSAPKIVDGDPVHLVKVMLGVL